MKGKICTVVGYYIIYTYIYIYIPGNSDYDCGVGGAIPKSLITEWLDVVGSPTFAVVSLYCY